MRDEEGEEGEGGGREEGGSSRSSLAMRRRLRLTNLVCGEHRIGKSIIPQCLGERITRGGVQHLHTPTGGGRR